MKKALVALIFPVIVFSLSHLAACQAASNSLDNQLITAAGNGDVAQVQKLLDQGANIEVKRQEQIEADLKTAWSNDPVVLNDGNGTPELQGKTGQIN
jgi:hypothetical protein